MTVLRLEKPLLPDMQDFYLNGLTLSVPDELLTPGLIGKFVDGTYEADEARAVDRCVREGFRVLDLGGGIGYIAALSAQCTAPENVLTVEANPALLPVIRHNLDANHAAEAEATHGAVTGTAEPDETAPLYLSDGFTGSSLKGSGNSKVDVPLIPFADLIQSHRPHVVFMDIEGAEAELFHRKWTCPLRYFVIELHPKKYPHRVIKRIVDFMSDMDMTYDPVVSRGKVLGFRKVWRER